LAEFTQGYPLKAVPPFLVALQLEVPHHLLANSRLADEPDGEPYYLLGTTMYYSMGRKDDAKRVLTTALTEAPRSARIAAYLGMVQLSSGDPTGAEKSFHAALALDSAEALALIGMGAIRYQQRWLEATEYLEKSRTGDPIPCSCW
jgi:lipoprotein NlpI